MLLAQNLDEIQKSALPEFKFQGGNIGDIISQLLPYLFAISGILLLLFLLYGGLSLMLSQGEPKAVQSAKEKITGAVIGFVIIFAAYWIVQIIGRVFGITQFSNIF